MSPLIERIESLQNNRFKEVCHLRTRASARNRQEGVSIMEGLHLLEEILSRSPESVRSIWIPEELEGEQEWCSLSSGLGNRKVFQVPPALWKKLSGLDHSLGPLTVFEVPSSHASVNFEESLLILDAIQDPGNVGTLLRVAAGAGLKQVACMPGTCWIWSDKAMRAGMGAQWAVSEVSIDVLSLFDQMPVAVTHLSKRSINLYDMDLSKPMAWVFGNEGRGASSIWLDDRSVLVKIPQAEAIESLNVATSAAVVLFEQRRQLMRRLAN